MANELKRYKSFFKVFQREILKMGLGQEGNVFYTYQAAVGNKEPLRKYYFNYTIQYPLDKMEYRESDGVVCFGVPFDSLRLRDVEHSGAENAEDSKAIDQKLNQLVEQGIYGRVASQIVRKTGVKDLAPLFIWDFNTMEFHMYSRGKKFDQISMHLSSFVMNDLSSYIVFALGEAQFLLRLDYLGFSGGLFELSVEKGSAYASIPWKD